MAEFEGFELDKLVEPDCPEDLTQFLSEFDTLENANGTLATLSDLAVYHAATGIDPFATKTRSSDNLSVPEVFIINWYNKTFHGILTDTGAASVSISVYLLVKALQKELPEIRIDTTT